MKKKNSLWIAIIVAAAFSIAAAIPAFASQYQIYDAEWDEGANGIAGKVYARWEIDEKCECEIDLKRNGSTVRTVSCGRATSYDFTRVLANLNKTGNYTFTVKPTKNVSGAQPGVDQCTCTEPLEIDSAYLKIIKTLVNAESEQKNANAPAGWDEGPGGWRYCKGNGVYAKNEWVDDGGYRYYIGPHAVMLTGWQQIKNYWYYFTPNKNLGRPLGSLYVNTVTPDGYYVNGEGIWIPNPTLQPQTQTVSGNVYQEINKVSITMQTTDMPAGGYRVVTGLTAGNAQFGDFAYAPAINTWQPGTTVTITATMYPKAGYRLSSNLTYSCSGATHVSVQGSGGDSRRVVITYRPKLILETPTGVYMDESEFLHWNKVSHANEYSIKIVQNGKTVTQKTADHSIDILAYADDYLYTPTAVSITATHTGKAKDLYVSSAAFSISDLNQFMNSGTHNGNFGGSGGNLYYMNDSGERVRGWNQIGGSWYYFNPANGLAAGPGWFQDPATGFWYYFNNKHCMMTGYVTDKGTVYFLNDGSVKGIPVGAWIQGR